MKKFLLVLIVLNLFLFCKTESRNKANAFVLPENAVQKKITPKQYIPFLPDKLEENSGLIIYNQLFWTINDSGGENKIFGVNFSGEIVKEISLTNAINIDWEDIAQDKDFIYVGDFGNNNGDRKNQKIYRVSKNKINEEYSQSIETEWIDFSFSDQTDFTFSPLRTPYDCEALIEFEGSLYVFTKDWKTQFTTVYKIPKESGKYSVAPLEKFNVNGLITAADISPDGNKIALLGYNNYKPFLWVLSDISNDSFFNGEKIYAEFDELYDAQTEGICFSGNDTLFISCESTASFIQQIFIIDLNSEE
jgi:hypothetical protein